jgi:hypothetical protein
MGGSSITKIAYIQMLKLLTSRWRAGGAIIRRIGGFYVPRWSSFTATFKSPAAGTADEFATLETLVAQYNASVTKKPY